MGNYEQLKQSVSDVIRTNGNQEITGSILQNVLLTIISTVGANATFAGIATPATNPGTPDGPVSYLASESGTYTNFGGITLMDEVAILSNTNGSWVKSNAGIATSTKVSELDGRVGTFDKNIQNVENNSYINVCVDADNKIIDAIDNDGTKHHYLPQVFHANIDAPNLITEEDIEGKQDILPYNVSNNEIEGYVEIKLDAERKLLEYTKEDGTKGFTSKIESPTIIDIYNQIREISSVSIVNIAKAKWKGKRYLAIGDSITWGVNAYNSVSGGVEYHQYAKNLCELLELAPHKRVNVPNDPDKTSENFADTTSSLNVGISGNIIQNVLAQEYAPIANKNFDIVTILIGINNVLNNSYTLGDTWYTIDSDGNRTYLLTGNTYKACFNKLLKTILEDNPKAKVLVMTLTHSDLDLKLNLENKGVEDYVNAIKEGCSIWGVECVDLFQNVQINPNIESKYQAYFRYDLNDALHPNIEAHKLITEEIIKHLI